MDQERDPKLWRIAKSRAQFRKSMFSYFIVCSFLWAVWWFTTGKHNKFNGTPWPLWVMLGWGIGLAYQYVNAYFGNKSDMIEEEYDKLKK
jgi:hypothetical protein